MVEDALVLLTNLGVSKEAVPRIVMYTAANLKAYMLADGVTDKIWINEVISEASEWVAGSRRSGNGAEGTGNANR